MSKFNKKDAESFGKVLAEIGVAIEENPSVLIDLLNTFSATKKVTKEKEIIREEVKTINVFDDYKDKKKSEIESELLGLNKEELKFLIKKFNLGPIRISSVEKLADFIADQVSKRTVDVFIKQE